MSSNIIKAIREDVVRLTSHKGFLDWQKDHKKSLKPDNFLLVNNSFLFRSGLPNKSNKYLALKISKGGNFEPNPYIAISEKRIISEFKIFPSTSKDITVFSLKDVIKDELDELGYLIFILVGELSDVIDEKVKIKNLPVFESLRWLTSAKKTVELKTNEIIVQQPYDVDAIWSEVSDYYQANNVPVKDNYEGQLVSALTELQNNATVSMYLPNSTKKISENTFVDRIVDSLKEKRNLYETALKSWKKSNYKNESQQTELLRISYIFANEVVEFLKLVVSICDLKPILLWGTVAEHYDLSKAFLHLKWTKTTKPLLDDYRDVVNTARNNPFHNIFSFKTAVEVVLPDGSVNNLKLRMFSEYKHKKENRMMFKDEELANVLLKFTRAQIRYTSEKFWTQNLHVIESVINLVERMGEFLRVLLAK